MSRKSITFAKAQKIIQDAHAVILDDEVVTYAHVNEDSNRDIFIEVDENSFDGTAKYFVTDNTLEVAEKDSDSIFLTILTQAKI